VKIADQTEVRITGFWPYPRSRIDWQHRLLKTCDDRDKRMKRKETNSLCVADPQENPHPLFGKQYHRKEEGGQFVVEVGGEVDKKPAY